MALRRFLLAVAGAAAFFCPPAAAQTGLAQVVTGQKSVGTTAVQIVAQRPRSAVIVTVTSATACSFGGASVTPSNGFPLQPVAGATLTLETSGAIYAVCASTATIGYVELY